MTVVVSSNIDTVSWLKPLLIVEPLSLGSLETNCSQVLTQALLELAAEHPATVNGKTTATRRAVTRLVSIRPQSLTEFSPPPREFVNL